MLRPLLCAAAVLALAGTAVAAPTAKTPAAKPASAAKAAPYKARRVISNVPDWTGVWGNYGSRNFDPTTDSGKPQPNAPLTPEARKNYEAYLAAVAKGQPRGDIGCIPEGPPRIMRSPYPHEVVITPKETWILAEFKGESRRIYTDGRKAPTGDDLEHTYEGYSTGHWEGDTLVFDTVGLKAGTIDSGGLVHSDKLTIHERMRRVDDKWLEDQITLTDPAVFTRPWTVTRRYEHQPTWEIKEFVCAENERNPVGANGETGVVLQNK